MTIVLEPQGFESYAVRRADGELKGFIAFAPVHGKWHAFNPAGEFVGADCSRNLAAELVT